MQASALDTINDTRHKYIFYDANNNIENPRVRGSIAVFFVHQLLGE